MERLVYDHQARRPLRPEPPPPPRELPPNLNLGVAPKLLIWMGLGFTGLHLALLPLPWLTGEAFVFALVVPGIVAGPILLAIGLRVRASRRELARLGQVALAHAVSVVDHVSSDGLHANPNWKDVECHYAVGGQVHRLGFTVRAPGPPVGIPLFWVIYDPARPQRRVRLE